MTTPRDLMIVAVEAESAGPVDSGDVSLALAAAEVLDLLAAGTVRLAEDRIVPARRRTDAPRAEARPPDARSPDDRQTDAGPPDARSPDDRRTDDAPQTDDRPVDAHSKEDTPLTDPQLNAALSAVVRDPPFETVDDWLWRRGRGLAATYLAALEAAGDLTRPRSRLRALTLRATRPEPADTPASRAARQRRASGEPVLSALVEAAGIGGERTGAPDRMPGGDGATVLAALQDALTELKFQRHRRALDQAAFDNVWRGGQ